MKDPMHWIVVADGARCRIYSSPARLERLKLERELGHPFARVPNHGIYSDAMGNRRENNAASHPASGDERHWEGRKKFMQGFAREVNDALERGFHDGEYEGIVLVCPPEFLGILRGELGHVVRNCVVAEIQKDYSKLDLHDLQKALKNQLDLTAV